jgi:putative ABC transport system ATP-binding protein
MPNRKLSGEAQRRSWVPSGTPITAPIRNGASLTGRIACRNFQTAQPCTIRPKAAIRTVDCAGGRKCSHIAAATMANAKPASPVTKEAAKVAETSRIRLTAESSPITHPIATAAKGTAGIGQRLACYSLRVVAGDLNTMVVQPEKAVNRQTATPEVPKDPEPPFQTDRPLLQVRDLRTNILKPASFSLTAGECIAVKGPSGAGKTLLLRAVADLDPNQGLVSLEGRDRLTIPGPEWRRLVGYVPAEPGWWAETVGEHFGDWNAAAADLTNLGFPEEAKSWPIARLSTGERLRLALVRALIIRPNVLLLDEPTAALDTASLTAVEFLIASRIRAGLAVLWVTHDVGQAGRIARRQLAVEAGRVREEVGQWPATLP